MRLKPFPHVTLLDALDAAARTPHGVTMLEWADSDSGTPLETRRSWAQLQDDARRVASQLRAAGVGPHAHVLMVLPNGLPFVTTFLATLMLGATPVPQPYPAPFDDPDALLWNLERIRERTGPAFLVLHEPLMERWAEEPRLAGFLRMLPPVPAASEPLTPAELPAVTPQHLALIQFTSGSTGHPRGVMLTHHNLLANCAAIAQGLHMHAADVGVSWLPLCHDMGLIGTFLTSMAVGIPLVLMGPFDFVLDPLRWLDAISRHGGTITTGPNFAYALCVRVRRSAVDAGSLRLHTWRAALCGAEPVAADVLERFSQKWAPAGFQPSALLPVYGLAESSLAVSFPVLGEPVKVDHVDRNALSDARRAIPSPAGMPWTVGLVGLGGAVAGHRVRVVDDEGRPRADREVGEICVRGPSVTQGYLHDAEGTAAILRGGWMHTGDLGYVADGHLHVCGRKKDVIIFRGRKYYPQDLERAAQDVDGVRKGNVVAFGEMDPGGGLESVTMVVERRGEDVEDAALVERVKVRVQECNGVPVGRVVVLMPGELPKTPSGKVRRNECRQRYGAHTASSS